MPAQVRPAMAVLCMLLLATKAWAGPQVGGALTLGGGAGPLDGPRTEPVFHLGGRGDLLFFRVRERSVGVGPYAQALTASFKTLELGGGLSLLLPVVESVPFVLSAGAHGRWTSDWTLSPGVHANLFAGSRSYNFHGKYSLSAGLFVEWRKGLGDSNQHELLGGVQVDFVLLALPFLAAYALLASSSR